MFSRLNNTATREGHWPDQLAGSRDAKIRACEENVREEPGRKIEKRGIRVRKGEKKSKKKNGKKGQGGR